MREANNSAVDFDQLQAACDGDAGLMRELLDLYFQQADEIMAALGDAIEHHSIADVNHLAHKLAGSSLACGMTAVVAPMRQLEGGAKAGHLNGAPEVFGEAIAQMERVRVCVRDYLAQVQP
jgi:HPt (histidine-containing phosphotransfer) domain-containing protein